MNISTMHWTYSHAGVNLLLTTDFKFEKAAKKENHHEKDNFRAFGPYIASEAGVEGLVHVLANELRGHKITVNALHLGL